MGVHCVGIRSITDKQVCIVAIRVDVIMGAAWDFSCMNRSRVDDNDCEAGLGPKRNRESIGAYNIWVSRSVSPLA